ncbi:hypothetical protein BMF94_2236 [Rhodotorula taiwanensis]|uniref:NAD(P)-binding domain-containing protein n=1 Tax=Rhodotorula taiwanensis TaxID=741276 RepID=A0A2S5BDB6_9BASI|nr:hypothetical protein BMF94_2236 [Rhodotorula taiwanensis]
MLSSCFAAQLSPASLLSSLFSAASLRSMSTVQLSSSHAVDLLVLGAGWTGTFLLPHLRADHPDISFATTTRDGRDGSIRWQFDPELEGPEQFAGLPRAKTVVVVFPIKGEGGSRRLVRGYEEAVGARARWIQLGSTGIFDGGATLAALRVQAARSNDAEKQALPSSPPPFEWTTRHSPYDKTNARAVAEDELLSMHEETVVLNLSGLWGGSRDPINWLSRVAPTEEALEQKGSLHLVHGLDVARAIVAVHLAKTLPTSAALSAGSAARAIGNAEEEKRTGAGQRWVLTDLHIVDWWDLASAHPSTTSDQSEKVGTEPSPDRALWVARLMQKHDVRALPRSAAELGRAIDAREFWNAFGLAPVKARWEKGRA